MRSFLFEAPAKWRVRFMRYQMGLGAGALLMSLLALMLDWPTVVSGFFFWCFWLGILGSSVYSFAREAAERHDRKLKAIKEAAEAQKKAAREPVMKQE